MKKYCCPECGGNLLYWNEYYYEKHQKINPYTGKLSKKVYKSEESDDIDHEGFRCENCEWTLNTINEQSSEILNEWFDENKGDLEVYLFKK